MAFEQENENLEKAIAFHMSYPLTESIAGAKEHLEMTYGIAPESLSIIEQAYLRNIVLETRDYWEEDMRACAEGKISMASTIEVEPEAAARFILEVYGITPANVHDTIMVGVVGKAGAWLKRRTFLRGEQGEAERIFNEFARKYCGEKEKRYELGKESFVFNHDSTVFVCMNYKISDTMKEYISILRAESHLL